jgi:hypothetical protein
MMARNEQMGTVGNDAPEGPAGLSPPVPALERIAVLLRHLDAQVAAMKQKASAGRQLSIVEEVPDLDRVLGPLEEVLATAGETFGLEPAVLDGRRAVRGALHILWADLIDMSPENLRKHWGVVDIPDHWPELHRQLLAAVEGAIAQL